MRRDTNRDRDRGSRGYTLLELLITLVIAATLFGVGYPALQSLVRETQLSAMVSSYLQAFNSARASALSVHRPITICALDAGGRCSGAWKDELSIFFDDDRNGVLALRDDIIGKTGSPSLKEVDVSFRAFRTTRYVNLRANGQYRQNGTFRFCPRQGTEGRAIVINVTGRARTEKVVCRR